MAPTAKHLRPKFKTQSQKKNLIFKIKKSQREYKGKNFVCMCSGILFSQNKGK
jgi:hypothetical protein